MTAKVFLVDDHALMRSGLRALRNFLYIYWPFDVLSRYFSISSCCTSAGTRR